MKKSGVLGNEEGFFKFILSLLVIGFMIYAGLQFGMPHYRHSAFRNDAVDLARISIGDVEKTKAQITERAQELKLPENVIKHLEVTKTAKGVRVKTSWSETVDLFGLYQKTFDFTVDIEE